MPVYKAIRLLLTSALVLSAGFVLAKDFPHKAHVDDYASGDCAACHSSSDKTITPNLDKCVDCHEKDFLAQVTYPAIKTHGVTWSLVHGQSAKSDQKACLNCHNEGNGPIGCSECHGSLGPSEAQNLTNQLFNVHRSEFKITHPLSARQNAKICASCHSTNFCNECHESFKPDQLASPSHRKGWSSLLTGRGPHSNETSAKCVDCHGPDGVLPDVHKWTDSHAREARRNLSTCQACHPEGDVCLNCHSAKTGLGLSPHPKGWNNGASSRLDKATNGKTCRKCH